MKKGFSIVELLIYCGLLSIILVVITNIFTSILNLQLETESSSVLAADGQYLLTKLTYDLRRGTQIVSPSLGSSSSTLNIIIDGTTYQYKLDNNNLIISPGGQLNSFQNKITNLTFTHFGAASAKEDTIQITFTLTSNIFQETKIETKNFSTTIGLRPN